MLTPREPELTRLTELKARLVESLAKFLGVPARVNRHEFHEAKLHLIYLYIDDCMLLAETVFDIDEAERVKLYNWLEQTLIEMIDNPFNMHDGPFWTVCHWHGIMYGNDPRLPEYEGRYEAALKNLTLNFI